MSDLISVGIGIQARSTSARFPGKVFAAIGDHMMIEHVIYAAERSANYINKFTGKNGISVSIAVLTPVGDAIKTRIKGRTLVVEGADADVLSRYGQWQHMGDKDYVVRITGDCPLIPHFVITKHIMTAIKNSYDYTSNVWEDYRMSPDGHDCEVLSRNALHWLLDHAQESADREHVTTLFRKKEPAGFRVGHVLGHLDLSHIKISVDTEEELEFVRTEHDTLERKIRSVIIRHGAHSVHRF